MRRKNSSIGPSLVEKAREICNSCELFSPCSSGLIDSLVLLAEHVNQAVKPGFLLRKVLNKEEFAFLISVLPNVG